MQENEAEFNKEKAVKNLSLSFFAQITVQFSRIVMNLVLARYFLNPDDFGLVNIGLVMVMFSNILTDFGFGQSLIQKQGVSQTDYSTAFWLNVGISSIIAICLVSFSLEISEFYKSPNLPPIIYGLVPVIVLNSLTIVQKVILSKQLRFKFLAINDSLATALGVITAITLGYFGAGPWALVAYQLVVAITSNIWLWIKVRHWRPTFEFSFSSIKEASHFSLNLLANNSLNYWSKNLDKLIIAKNFGQHTLGLYSQSFTLVLIPVANISNVIVKVLFPTFSIIQKQKQKISEIFAKVSRAVLYINSAIFMSLFVVSDLFVRVIFGKKWEGMEDILAVFCFIGLILSIRTVQSGVFMSLNKNGLLLILNIISRSITIIALLLTVKYGVFYMSLSLVFTFLFSWILNSFYLNKALNSKQKSFFLAHLTVFLQGIIAMAISFSFKNTTILDRYLFIKMVTCVIVFLVSYFLLSLIVKDSSLFEIKKVIVSKIQSGQKRLAD